MALMTAAFGAVFVWCVAGAWRRDGVHEKGKREKGASARAFYEDERN